MIKKYFFLIFGTLTSTKENLNIKNEAMRRRDDDFFNNNSLAKTSARMLAQQEDAENEGGPRPQNDLLEQIIDTYSDEPFRLEISNINHQASFQNPNDPVLEAQHDLLVEQNNFVSAINEEANVNVRAVVENLRDAREFINHAGDVARDLTPEGGFLANWGWSIVIGGLVLTGIGMGFYWLMRQGQTTHEANSRVIIETQAAVQEVRDQINALNNTVTHMSDSVRETHEKLEAINGNSIQENQRSSRYLWFIYGSLTGAGSNFILNYLRKYWRRFWR